MIEADFRRAVDRLHYPPARKLLDPGPLPFIKRWLGRRGEGRVVQAQLFFGRTMNVVLPEIVSEQIYTYGLFDEVVSWLAIRATSDGDTVLDVGGHFGYFTALFSALVGDSGRVVAFEPTPSTYGLLASNARQFRNVVVENFAVGRSDGQAELSDYGLKYCAWNSLAVKSRLGELPAGARLRKVSVGMTTIDGYVRMHRLSPALIKIDAENFEAEVIGGAEDTITRFAPSVIMECGSDAALQAGRRLVADGYATLVSEKYGELYRWTRDLKSANERFKDILFVPSSRMSRFVRD